MEVIKKIAAKNADIYNVKPVTIAFLGDSVTQGCFEVFYKLDGNIETIFESDKAFSVNVKKILNYLYPSAQINVINSGISGDNAENGNRRFERDIAPYLPDLVVVGFALNDCGRGEEGKEIYEKSLRKIFQKVKNIGAECICLTPNMMNDRISPHIHDNRLQDLAKAFINFPLDDYVAIAKKVAAEQGVIVCDIYDKWKCLQANGVDITELLSNKLNHPTREMNWLTAYLLVETMFEK